MSCDLPDKVREELNRVVGVRQVRVQDKQNLPFMNAVIHETQRLANILPVALAHKTSQDVTFQGHFIEQVGAFFLQFGQSFKHQTFRYFENTKVRQMNRIKLDSFAHNQQQPGQSKYL